jgi:hypothetical protein
MMDESEKPKMFRTLRGVEPWERLRPHVEYLKKLKNVFRVSIFSSYRSNCDTAGFEVSHKFLEMFTASELPFGVSVIIV